MDSSVRIVVAVSKGKEPEHQFALSAGDILSVGRAPGSDVLVDLRGVSGRHAEIFIVRRDGIAVLNIRDRSTNGTGAADPGTQWVQLEKGVRKAFVGRAQVLVPFNRASKEDEATVLGVRLLGTLPDPYDERTRTGRWKYRGILGEGALGVVWGASDATGLLNEVAIKLTKVLKSAAKPSQHARHAYILHREAQWSLQWLHKRTGPHFDEEKARLFMRYLEDHTGAWLAPSLCFDAERSVLECTDFMWDKFEPQPPLPSQPYVVMELMPGRTVHSALGLGHDQGLDPPMRTDEKLIIAEQAADALEYLSAFGLIHRDFRTTNLMISGRSSEIRMRVIDLGHAIAAEDKHMQNRSPVVKCQWKETKTKRFDWAPPAVKKSGVNFEMPAHAFDVFSFAVLLLQLESSNLQTARSAIQEMSGFDQGRNRGVFGLDNDFLRRMLGDAQQRPHPQDVQKHLLQGRVLPSGGACDVRARSRSRDSHARINPGVMPPLSGEGGGEVADDHSEVLVAAFWSEGSASED